jgi:hypothetical protein
MSEEAKIETPQVNPVTGQVLLQKQPKKKEKAPVDLEKIKQAKEEKSAGKTLTAEDKKKQREAVAKAKAAKKAEAAAKKAGKTGGDPVTAEAGSVKDSKKDQIKPKQEV